MNKRTLIGTISPLVRGLAYDGEKGPIVHFVPESEAAQTQRPELILNLSIKEDQAVKGENAKEEANRQGEEYIKEINKAFTRFVKDNSVYPKVLFVPNFGRFCLGERYDDALSLSKGNTSDRPLRKPAQQQRADYNRTVAGKVCLVTGAAQGFGAGIARSLAEHGAFVFIADLNADGARRFATELNKTFGEQRALGLEVNMAQEESVAAMFAQIAEETGGLDICISNAGVLKAAGVREMSLSDFSFVTSVNYTGYFLCVKHAAPLLAMQNRGAVTYFSDIIQINSKSGLEGSNKNAAYAGGKFGGIGLTQSFAKELIEDNIKVNAVCPGNFFEGPLWSDPERGLFVQYLRAGKVPGAKTIEDVKHFYEEKVPMKRGCRIEDLVRAIFYIVGQRYETGQAVPVTGGQVMLS